MSIAFTGLLATAAATAQTHEQPEWNDLNISGVNKETACQTAIPFADEGQALRLSIEESPYYQTLNGTWKFHWVADPEKRPKDFFKPDYDVSDWDNIKVPATWQIEAVRHNKPWDKPLYCNTIYPFCDYSKGVQWPNVIQPRPADYTFANMPNPVGSYRREFTLPTSWKGRDVFIRFNGVEAGFYLWLNGKKVGYSEDSYLPAEFNLTPYLQEGKTHWQLKCTVSPMEVFLNVKISGGSAVSSAMYSYGQHHARKLGTSSSEPTWTEIIVMLQFFWTWKSPVRKVLPNS